MTIKRAFRGLVCALFLGACGGESFSSSEVAAGAAGVAGSAGQSGGAAGTSGAAGKAGSAGSKAKAGFGGSAGSHAGSSGKAGVGGSSAGSGGAAGDPAGNAGSAGSQAGAGQSGQGGSGGAAGQAGSPAGAGGASGDGGAAGAAANAGNGGSPAGAGQGGSSGAGQGGSGGKAGSGGAAGDPAGNGGSAGGPAGAGGAACTAVLDAACDPKTAEACDGLVCGCNGQYIKTEQEPWLVCGDFGCGPFFAKEGEIAVCYGLPPSDHGPENFPEYPNFGLTGGISTGSVPLTEAYMNPLPGCVQTDPKKDFVLCRFKGNFSKGSDIVAHFAPHRFKNPGEAGPFACGPDCCPGEATVFFGAKTVGGYSACAASGSGMGEEKDPLNANSEMIAFDLGTLP